MSAKTGLVLILLGMAAIVAAYGIWFGFKAYQGWKDGTRVNDRGEPGWLILGTLGGVACLIALVKLAYDLASAFD